MKIKEAKKGMLVRLIDNPETLYKIEDVIPNSQVVNLSYRTEWGRRASGGIIDVSLLKRIGKVEVKSQILDILG